METITKKVPSDLEIAQAAPLIHIKKIAARLGIGEEDLEYYGKYKAKLPLKLISEEKILKSKLILVTAISPTPAGEGKTTMAVGLADGLNKIGKNAMTVLREPSLGPLFGIKGGAAGGGWRSESGRTLIPSSRDAGPRRLAPKIRSLVDLEPAVEVGAPSALFSSRIVPTAA